MTINFKLVLSDIYLDITHIKVNNGRMSAILNLTVNFFRAHLSLKLAHFGLVMVKLSGMIFQILSILKVDNGSKSPFFKFDRVEIFQGVSLPETMHFVLWFSYFALFSRYYAY